VKWKGYRAVTLALILGLSPWRSKFCSKSVHVGFVLEKWNWDRFFL